MTDLVQVIINNITDSNSLLTISPTSSSTSSNTVTLISLIATKLRYLGAHLLYLSNTHHYPGHSITNLRLNNTSKLHLKLQHLQHQTLGYLGPNSDILDTSCCVFTLDQYINPLSQPKFIELSNSIVLSSDIEVISETNIKFTFSLLISNFILSTGHISLNGSDIENSEIEGIVYLHRHSELAGETSNILELDGETTYINTYSTTPIITEHYFIPFREISSNNNN
jgi:hypothetical protein